MRRTESQWGDDGWEAEEAYQRAKAERDYNDAKSKYEKENPGSSYDDSIEPNEDK